MELRPYQNEAVRAVEGEWEQGRTKTNKIPEGEIWYIRSVQTINRITLENYPLENLDTIRDKILLTAGDTIFDI